MIFQIPPTSQNQKEDLTYIRGQMDLLQYLINMTKNCSPSEPWRSLFVEMLGKSKADYQREVSGENAREREEKLADELSEKTA